MTTAELLAQLDHNPLVTVDSHASWLDAEPEDEP